MQIFALKFSVLEKSLLVLSYLASLTFCRFLIQTKGKKGSISVLACNVFTQAFYK